MADLPLSATSLQDFADCPRRFELTYLKQLDWPREVNLAALELGNLLHRTVQQYLLGIPISNAPVISSEIDLHNLRQIVSNALSASTSCENKVEYQVQLVSGSTVIVGKFDFLQICPDGSVHVYDWKTDQHFKSRGYYEKRIQTKLYLWLASQLYVPRVVHLHIVSLRGQGSHIFQPSPAEIIRYGEQLTELSAQVRATPEGGFNRTFDKSICEFCKFDTYCN